ncbi:MAG TPA: hypothetical protein VE953_11515 [Terriglobales bacterium]|nr:hypothetical protein [Terriglobales bacterium]
MLITFALLIAAAAVSPAIWFSWWVLADIVESRRPRRAASVVAVARVARAQAAVEGYERAA